MEAGGESGRRLPGEKSEVKRCRVRFAGQKEWRESTVTVDELG